MEQNVGQNKFSLQGIDLIWIFKLVIICKPEFG